MLDAQASIAHGRHELVVGATLRARGQVVDRHQFLTLATLPTVWRLCDPANKAPKTGIHARSLGPLGLGAFGDQLFDQHVLR
jgi:hypothetical protein